ncbi:DNA-packaging protein [Devosia sp. CN2-171]|uniref:DNA-packaging protein n=1 Tax=Devosia sp. CN2-171 TaxID=3400909 RepID=UPI003BF8DE14
MSSRSAKTLFAQVADDELPILRFDWDLWAHDEQREPAGDWTTWLLMGGRGAGKTLAGAEWVRGLAKAEIGPIAIVGETMIEALQVMVRGPSGILRSTPPEDRPIVRGQVLQWPNGVEGLVLGASDPERFRGPQFAAAWCDEVGKWPDAEAAWDMLQFGLRLGDAPRQLATTTPRATPLIRRLLKDPLTTATRMPTKVNQNNLARSFFSAIVARYENTVLGRQELDGELIEDRPDALWLRGMFRVDEGAELGRIVVAVDPPVTGHKGSDACGIVVAAKAGQGAVVLADLSFGPARPEGWARRAVAAFHEFGADCIVAEVNQGGDLVKSVIAQEDANVPVRAVHASRGKWVRAEPVAALYANGRVAHRAGLAALEDEMCAFGADGKAEGHSPDRVDALVWALTELMLGGGEPRVRGI